MNTKIILSERPPLHGPINSTTFRTERHPIPRDGDLKQGEVVVRTTYLSLDPAMRGWMNDVKSYIPPVKLGAVMRSVGVGRVVASKCKDVRVGMDVMGEFSWQEYWKGPSKYCEVLNPPKGATPLDYLGPLGSSGMTAYFGLYDNGKLKDGETVVISGAAGSVGLVVVQLALTHPNCTVVAIAGSEDKVKNLKELGCHHVYNYKDKEWMRKFRKEVKGVDVYFDNVGGPMLDFMITRLNNRGRVAFCGAISGYNDSKPYGLLNYQALISSKASIQGFIVLEYEHRYQEGREVLAKMLEKGQLKYKYSEVDGVNKAVEGFKGLFEGVNEGKAVIKVWDGNDQREHKL